MILISEIENLQPELLNILAEESDINISLKEYDTIIKTTPVAIDKSLEPPSAKMAYEDFYYDSDEMWDNIENNVRNFIQKIKNFWNTVIMYIKKEIVAREQEWYESNQYSISFKYKDLNDDNGTLDISYTKYKVQNPISELISDILKANQIMTSIYDTSYKAIHRMMDTDQARIYNANIDKGPTTLERNNNIKDQLENEIKNDFNLLCTQCHITYNDKGKLNEKGVKDAITNKFIDKEASETDYKKFISSEKDIELLYSSETSRSFITTADTMMSGSKECEAAMAKLRSYINSSDNDAERESYKNDIKSGALHALMDTLSVCNILGATYFNLFVKMRRDGKKILHAILKYKKEYK